VIRLTRRAALAAPLACGLASLCALAPASAVAQTAAPYAPSPVLIEAAQKEGKAVWYTSTDVAVSERMAKLFEAKYPGVKVQVERSGAERIYQRLNQEYGSNIKNADIVETSDAVHFIVFKRKGWLAQAVPEDVAKHWPAIARDLDGYYAAYRAHLSVMGYNSKLLKAEDAPKSRAALLDPKWRNRLVKAHPGYSGTILNDTFMIVQTPGLGWDYLAKLGQQRIMQVQSSTEPPKKLALGERLVMVDGNEYNLFQLKEKGDPVEPIYPEEGTTIAIGHSAILKDSTRPNAARLLYHFLFTAEAQQAMSDSGGLRSFHPGVKENAARTPLSKIKVLYPDASKLEAEVEDIKKRYEQHFGT
jgi:iron(III) transport system substrate-binding protein